MVQPKHVLQDKPIGKRYIGGSMERWMDQLHLEG